MRAIVCAAGVAFCALAVLPLSNSGTAGAQSWCAPASRAVSASPAPVGSSPTLDRKVSLHGKGISLREALDRVAATARIRLSYTAELLPLAQPVCLEYKSATVGQVLSDLLEGTAVSPVVVGTDQIALTPVRESETPELGAKAVPIMKQVGLLNRVVVTGNATSTSQRALPIALDVVSGEQLSQRHSGSLSGTLDGAVPGLWLWEQSPLSMLARYGSIRGASSFGVSYPKVYVDGIEVANSLLVTHLDPDAISRIEVIRGPQGAALYGADAISGVINIVTRQEGLESGAPRVQIRAEGGTSASDYSESSVITQRHAATVRYGNGVRSTRLGMTTTRIGAFIPDAFSQQFTANGSLRFVNSRSVLTGTFRVFAQDAHTPTNPLLADLDLSSEASEPHHLDSLSRLAVVDSSDRQAVRQFTLGGSASFTGSERWTHSAVAGVDGYTLRNATMLDGEFPSATDSALRAATGNAVRATVRASSVGQFGDQQRASATVTISAEHSVVRDETTTQSPFTVGTPEEPQGPSSTSERRSNTGVIGQVSTGFRDAVFLSGGLRIERNSGPDGVGDIATLPMLGASVVRSFGTTTIKLRSAFGKGIRPVQTTSRAGTLMGLRGSLLGSSLSPEEQSGTEFGADAFIGRLVALHVTRFDQRASGLVQPVSVAARVTTDDDDDGPRYQQIVNELQNVGEITNRGWELQGSITGGPWSVGATVSKVNSRVTRLSEHYTGDLRPGDRMLKVPSHTFGVNTAFTQGRWSASWTLSRASDWINYDRLALLTALATASPDDQTLIGPGLRSFWKSYNGVTRLGARLGVSLTRGMTFTLDGENLLDEQRGEPDNVTVLPGRTLSAGIRISF